MIFKKYECLEGVIGIMSQYYIILSVVVILVVALMVFFLGKGKKENHLTPIAGLAFGFVLAGILFGEERWLGYGLMGIGVVLAVIDIVRKPRTPS